AYRRVVTRRHERGGSRRTRSLVGERRRQLIRFLQTVPARSGGFENRSPRGNQSSLQQSQLLFRPSDRRVCAAPRRATFDRSSGGGAGRRSLHKARVVNLTWGLLVAGM